MAITSPNFENFDRLGKNQYLRKFPFSAYLKSDSFVRIDFRKLIRDKLVI